MATLASYPGLLTPVFVACDTNAEEGLVKLSRAVTYLDVWRSGTNSISVQLLSSFLNSRNVAKTV